MKIRFLGTGASEGIPGMFCGCDTCKRALKAGGRNIMTRSQTLIDENLLIDYNSDTYFHFLKEGKTLSDIENILITHVHNDHFSMEDNVYRTDEFARNLKAEKLTFYLSEFAFNYLQKLLAVKFNENNKLLSRFRFKVITPFEKLTIGDYTITPLPAIHSYPDEDAFIFLIEKDGKTLFYATDTGYFHSGIDKYLLSKKVKIDLLVLDCTKGDNDLIYEMNMSMKEGKAIADRFANAGLLAKNAKLIYTHFSHNSGQIYKDFVVRAQKYGFEVAYDGLEIEI